MPPVYEYTKDFRRSIPALLVTPAIAATVLGWPAVAWARMAVEAEGAVRLGMVACVGLCVLIVLMVGWSAWRLAHVVREYRVTLDAERLRMGARVRTRWTRCDIAVGEIERLVRTRYPFSGGDVGYMIRLRNGDEIALSLPFGSDDEVCEGLFAAITGLRAGVEWEERVRP